MTPAVLLFHSQVKSLQEQLEKENEVLFEQQEQAQTFRREHMKSEEESLRYFEKKFSTCPTLTLTPNLTLT